MNFDNLMKESVDRRGFVTRIGALGLGVAAAGIMAGCGGGDSGGGSSYNASVSSSEIRNSFQEIMKDEDNHVAFLISAITSAGGTPRPAPIFTQSLLASPDIETFIKQSAALENTGTGAYLAAVPLPALTASPATLQAAASIALVEGRHAGFLNSLLSHPLLTDPNQNDAVSPSNSSREVAELPDQVLQRAAPFLGTVGNGTNFQTNLNGGAAPPTNATIASATLFDILNYALLLEYLEKSFYDLNVPRFFP